MMKMVYYQDFLLLSLYKVLKDLRFYFLKKLILMDHINGLVQERGNSIANTLLLRLSCMNPSISYVKSVIINCVMCKEVQLYMHMYAQIVSS